MPETVDSEEPDVNPRSAYNYKYDHSEKGLARRQRFENSVGRKRYLKSERRKNLNNINKTKSRRARKGLNNQLDSIFV